MKRITTLLFAAAFLAVSAFSAFAAEKLVVYTSMKESIIGSLKEAFVKKYPDIAMDYQSAGAGKLMAKIATERQSGKIMADIIWTSEVPDFFNMKAEGILEKYESPELKAVINPFPDYDGSFTAIRLGTLGIAYNKRHVKEAPTQWSDMMKPEFKKAFGIANPSLSGTSYMSIQLLVDKFGWEYIENVHKNGARMGKGSGQVIDDTASGDLLACIGVDYIVNDKIKKGADLALVYPPEMLVIPSPAAIASPSARQRCKSSPPICLGARMASLVWACVHTISGSAMGLRRQPVAMRSIWRAALWPSLPAQIRLA